MVSSFRMQAVMVSLEGLPAARSRWAKGRITGLQRIAARVARSAAVDGVSDAGLKTTAFPATSAGAG